MQRKQQKLVEIKVKKYLTKKYSARIGLAILFLIFIVMTIFKELQFDIISAIFTAIIGIMAYLAIKNDSRK